MRGVINRSLDDSEGLQSADYSVYQLFEKDDLVFKLIDLENIKTSRVGIVPETGIMSPAYIRLKPNSESVVPRYYYWYFYAVYLNNVFNTLGGGIRQNLVVSDLLEVPVPDIPITLQANIADYLDKETSRIESLIAEKQNFIDLLKEKRQALISHFVTKGLDDNVPMKDSGVEWIGEVPEHWGVAKLKWIASTESGGTPSIEAYEEYYEGGNIPWIRTTDLNNSEMLDTPIRITEKALKDTACKWLNENTVLVAMYGGAGSIGKHAITRFKAAINQAICAVKPSQVINPDFFHLYLEFYRPFWMLDADGTRKDPNINQDAVRNLVVPLPPVGEQETIFDQFSKQSNKLMSLMTETELSIELLKEHRTALISAAVTGKIDVRGMVDTKEGAA